MFGASNAFVAVGSDSPMKAVKKMRVESGEIVRDWDGRGSPERRIITRSNRAEELVSLDEEEPQDQDAHVEEEEVLRVEVVSEDGVAQEIHAEEELQQDEWEDESATEEDVWDATLMHLGEVGDDAVTSEDPDADAGEKKKPESETIEANHTATEAAKDEGEVEGTVSNDSVQDAEPALAAVDSEPAAFIQAKPSMQAPVLPDGFVSPVKERRRRPISQVRQAQAHRRRTLPVDFSAAGSRSSTEAPKAQDVSEHPANQHEAEEPTPIERTSQSQTSTLEVEEPEIASNAEATTYETNDTDEGLQKSEPTTENGWEDVEDEDEASDRDVAEM